MSYSHRYLKEVGAKAYANSACLESIAHYEKALAALEHLPASREREEQVIDLRLDLSNPLFLLGDMRYALAQRSLQLKALESMNSLAIGFAQLQPRLKSMACARSSLVAMKD